VTDHPSFGVLLARLLKLRGTSVTSLSASCGVAESEIRSVIDGAPPNESQLHALATALGFHAADLFVIADVPLPEDLTPLDHAAGEVISYLIHVMMALPPDQRLCIHRLVGELPQQPRPRNEPVKWQMTYNQREAGFGAVLVSMLCSQPATSPPSPASNCPANHPGMIRWHPRWPS
jgi:lambda repressor-like predicted transcriptional regulator